jgi:RimJ/RimL family protein N-acetyltransferase
MKEKSGEQWTSGPPCVGVVRDGIVISACHCARFTDRGAEAGLETLEAYRGQGFGTSAAAGWARVLRGMGREPLYSTSWENLASQGVARKLGLIFYGVDFSIT